MFPAAQVTPQEKPQTIEELQKQALQEGESGKTEDAIRDYKRALELQPTWKEGRWNLGTLQYEANQFAEAKSTFQQVIEFAPDLGVAWSLLGLSEFETRDCEDALTHLEKALSLGIKDDAEIERVSNYHLALLLIRSGEFERAADLLITAFGSGAISQQIKIALGLATLRVPLLPDQIDPSQDALISEVGDAVASGTDTPVRLQTLLAKYPDIPYLHHAYALALTRTDNSTGAVAAFQEETRISPESPLPWIELSRLELKQPSKAVQAAQKAVELAPASKPAHQALASAWEAAGDARQAAQELKAAATLTTGPSPPESRILQRYSVASPGAKPDISRNTAKDNWDPALREYLAAQYPAAASHLKEWLKVNPNDGTGWAMLGLCEFSMQDFNNALIHLDRGAQLGLSGSAESLQTARYTLGILLVHTGNFERASDVLQSANGSSPANAKVKFALGLALLRRPQFPDAVPADQAALITGAGEIAILLQQSKYDDAFAQFKRLLAAYPSSPFLHYGYGTALLALSEFDEAAAQMQAEIAISPRSELPLLRQASIALRQHRSTDAITWAQRAIILSPNSAEAHYLLGRASLEVGDDSVALSELQTAGKLSPASPEVHFNLAKAYDRVRMPEKAQQERATFSRLNAAAENQRSHEGSQIYSGPHNSKQLTDGSSPSLGTASHPQ